MRAVTYTVSTNDHFCTHRAPFQRNICCHPQKMTYQDNMQTRCARRRFRFIALFGVGVQFDKWQESAVYHSQNKAKGSQGTLKEKVLCPSDFLINTGSESSYSDKKNPAEPEVLGKMEAWRDEIGEERMSLVTNVLAVGQAVVSSSGAWERQVPLSIVKTLCSRDTAHSTTFQHWQEKRNTIYLTGMWHVALSSSS